MAETTRKYLSGAAKRKAAKEKAAAYAAATAAAEAPPAAPVADAPAAPPAADVVAQPPAAPPARRAAPPAPDPGAAAATASARARAVADFGQLEPPPLGAPARAIAWVNDAVLLALDQVLRDPALTNPERWRWIKDLSAVLGMVRDKASEQADIKRVLEQQQKAEHAQGTVPADGRLKKEIPRPPG